MRPTVNKVKNNLRQAWRELRGQAPMPGDVLPAEAARPSDGSLRVAAPQPKQPPAPVSALSRVRQALSHIPGLRHA